MRAAFRSVLLFAIALSIFSYSTPLRAEFAPAPKPGCCALSASQTKCDARAHHCPRTPLQERECCVACPLCFSLFLTQQPGFISSSILKGELSVISTRALSRVDRPPVPPPRFAAA